MSEPTDHHLTHSQRASASTAALDPGLAGAEAGYEPEASLAWPRAVLWDMDGTLVDTEPYWFAAERDLVDQFGHGDWPNELAQGMVGFDLLDGAAYLQRHGGVDLPAEEIVDRLLDGVIARLHRHIPWRDGARELLAELADEGVPCALVTMSWRRFVDPVLAALPTGTFTAVITGDEIPHGEGKPAPTPYLLGAEACGADPRDCVAIEDSPTGVASALAAGCVVIGVPNVVEPAPAPGMTLVDNLEGIRAADLADLYAHHRSGAGVDRGRDLRFNRKALIALVVATVIGLGLWWWSSRGDDTPPLPPGAVAVDVWVPYWTLEDVTADGVDRLSIAREVSPFWFGTRAVDQIVVDEHAPVEQTEAFLDEVDDSHLVPSIRDQMPAGGMAAIIADPVQRAQHIDTILAFADEQDASGIDLDYEQFAFADDHATWETTRPNWVTFVQELSTALHADGRTLTVSIPGVWNRTDAGSEGYWVYDHGAIAQYVDAMRIMAYDYSVAEPGPIAPAAWVADVVATVSEVVPEEFHGRLVLGVPSYGVNWVASTTGECPATAEGRTGVSARNALELAARRSGTPQYDPATAEWSFAYDLTVEDGAVSCVQHRRVQWVDAEGVAARVQLARDAGWGGVALWALGYDDAEVWTSLTTTARQQAQVS